MATEKVITKVKYRLKNGESTTLPIGTKVEYVETEDGTLVETLDNIKQQVSKITDPRRIKRLELEDVQRYLDEGTINLNCQVGDYVVLQPEGSSQPYIFFIIGINGHNGQFIKTQGQSYTDSIRCDHVDFYGGSVYDLIKDSSNLVYLEDRNFAIPNLADSKWKETTFYNTFISQKNTKGKMQAFFGTTDSINFAPKFIYYDQKSSDNFSAIELLKIFGFDTSIASETYEALSALKAYEVNGALSTNTTRRVTMGDMDEQTGEISYTVTDDVKDMMRAVCVINNKYSINSETSLLFLRLTVQLLTDSAWVQDLALTEKKEQARKVLHAFREYTKQLGQGHTLQTDLSLTLLRVSVGYTKPTSSNTLSDGEWFRLYTFLIDLYDWIEENQSGRGVKASIGQATSAEYLWMLTEEEIDPYNILGSPLYTCAGGYRYPFFENKQFFRFLFPNPCNSNMVFRTITPVEGSYDEYVGWTIANYGLCKGKIKGTLSSGQTACEGFGFRLESSSLLQDYPEATL